MKGTPVSLRKPGASGLSGSESKHLERLEESQRADGTDEACVRPGCPRSCLPASQNPPTWLPGSRSPPSVCRKASPDPTLHFDLLTLHQALADGAFTHPSSLGLPTATQLGSRPVSSTPKSLLLCGTLISARALCRAPRWPCRDSPQPPAWETPGLPCGSLCVAGPPLPRPVSLRPGGLEIGRAHV